MTVAFVFQGGSSLAAAQVGMLRALLEAGIRPDLVVGTSAGAVNAVSFAQNPTTAGLEELELLWTRVRRRAATARRQGVAQGGKATMTADPLPAVRLSPSRPAPRWSMIMLGGGG